MTSPTFDLNTLLAMIGIIANNWVIYLLPAICLTGILGPLMATSEGRKALTFIAGLFAALGWAMIGGAFIEGVFGRRR